MANRTTLETRIRDTADAVGATRDWPQALLLSLADNVFYSEWASILAAAPYYRTNTVPVTVDSNGRVSWADLTTGTGDSRKVPFRVLHVVRDTANADEIIYIDPARVHTIVAGNVTPATWPSVKMWTRDGDDLQFYGVANESVHVKVNWMPPMPSELSAGTAEVDFPTAALPVLWNETAALMLAKGGRETTEAGELQALAEVLRERFLNAIRRTSATPAYIPADDDIDDWQ